MADHFAGRALASPANVPREFTVKSQCRIDVIDGRKLVAPDIEAHVEHVNDRAQNHVGLRCVLTTKPQSRFEGLMISSRAFASASVANAT